MIFLQNFKEIIQQNVWLICAAGLTTIATFVIYRRRGSKFARKWRPEWKHDVVYLHVLPRSGAGSIVNLSPFALKVELWLRINKLQYEIIDFAGYSSKGQSPFIMFNETEIPDSNFIVEYLSKYFGVDPYPGLKRNDKGVGRAFLKMIEESTVWTIFQYRYVEHIDEYAPYFLPNFSAPMRKFIQKGMRKAIKDRLYQHGIGRNTYGEIQKIGCDDLLAISDFLADKKFLIGDSPSLVDCSLFGVVAQVLCVPLKYPQRRLILEDCENILHWFDRMKTTYWPDWDEQCKL